MAFLTSATNLPNISFSIAVAKIRKAVPLEIRSSDNLSQFKGNRESFIGGTFELTSSLLSFIAQKNRVWKSDMGTALVEPLVIDKRHVLNH